MRVDVSQGGEQRRFESLCLRLAKLDRRLLGRRARKDNSPRARERRRALAASLELAGIHLTADIVQSAARGALLLCGSVAIGAFLPAMLTLGLGYGAVLLFVASATPLIAREALMSYPAGASKRRAEKVMRGVPEAANLMIMSLRHEPSLSRAIRFASERGSEFSRELKRCVWDVVMGRHSSFEDSIQAVGSRWEKHDPDLKASIHAMVTASCERTQDGKRRALDRANNAVMSGAKRRIEAYALSLSAPSMVIFSLGILLPLMVGSFLPMMSWSVWSPATIGSGDPVAGDGNLLETILLMNFLFPLIALMIAVGAVSRHPMRSTHRRISSASVRVLVTAGALSWLCALVAFVTLEGTVAMAATLVLGTVPLAGILMALGGALETSRDAGASSTGLEDALFRTGARMLEGENFESALQHSGADTGRAASETIRKLSFRSAVAGQGFDEACRDESKRWSDANALDGLRVVREAAAKDEMTAGMLAMDLAAYLKDLHDLETTLKNRLKPTISMMRATAFALGPIVMGVTFAIYLTLVSMAPGGAAGLDSKAFFLVLGVFLVETNGVVSYFVWGIEGARDVRVLMMNLGTCILVSELVYIATAIASA